MSTNSFFIYLFTSFPFSIHYRFRLYEPMTSYNKNDSQKNSIFEMDLIQRSFTLPDGTYGLMEIDVLDFYRDRFHLSKSSLSLNPSSISVNENIQCERAWLRIHKHSHGLFKQRVTHPHIHIVRIHTTYQPYSSLP